MKNMQHSMHGRSAERIFQKMMSELQVEVQPQEKGLGLEGGRDEERGFGVTLR